MKPLTSQQKQIIQKIRTLHAQGQPLNISAVKRNQPQLLDRVMTLRHFRGWRKALEAAGLSYRKIKIELLDHCICAICKEKHATLDAHLRTRHRLTREKYLRKFPGEELLSDKSRAERTAALQEPPHWEPVWSREYLIDYLIYKHEQQQSLSPWTVYRYESALHGNIKKYFGSYRAGIEAAGIEYAEVRTIDLTERWTAQKVLDRIRALDRQEPLNSSSDIRRRDPRLYDSCHRYFGGPVPAIEAAGILYIRLKARRSRQWTRNNVLHTIRALDTMGSSLRPAALTNHLNGQAAELLAVAEDRFGSWDNAVRAAGIDYDNHRGRRTLA